LPPQPEVIKEKVLLELDKMLAAGIIEPVEEYDWVSPMVV